MAKEFLNQRVHLFHVGVEYYRAPVPPEQFWDDDLRRIRAAGMRIVRSFTCWNWQEPAPSRYEFDDLDRLFDLAHKHDLKVWLDITVATHVACPEWLLRMHPDMAAVRHDGSVQHPTSGPWAPQGVMIHNFDHPKWKQYAGSFIRAIVTHFKDHPAMGIWGTCDGVNLSAAWSIGEEYPSYNDYTIAKYIGWLKERYTLEQLNERTLRRWRCWEDVQPARSNDNLVEMKLYRQFHYENLASMLAWMAGLVDELDGRHEQRSHGTTMPRQWDTLCSPHVDSWGLSFKSATRLDGTAEPDGIAFNYFGFDWARSVGRGGRWWAEEIYAGNQGRLLAATRQTTPVEATLPLWLSLVAGAAGALYWQYRPEYMSFEAPGLNLVALDGGPTPRWTAVADAIRQIERIAADHLPLTIPQAEVAVVYSAPSHEIFFFAGQEKAFQQNLCVAHRRLWSNSIPCDVITPEMDWANYKLVILPNVAVIDDALAERLGRTLRDGTTRVVAHGHLGSFNEKGHWSFSPPELVHDLFPARIEDFDQIQPTSIETNWGPARLASATDSAILLPQPGARPAATTPDGRVIAIETDDQRAAWLGFPLAALEPAWLDHFLIGSGAASNFEFAGDRLIGFRRVSRGGQALAFLFNFASRPARSRVAFRWRVRSAVDLLSGQRVGLDGNHANIEIPAQGVRLLALE